MNADFYLAMKFPVCKFITNFLGASIYGIHPDFFNLLPYLCTHVNNDLHPRLVEMCSHSLTVMSASVVRPPFIPSVLQKINKATKLKFWKGRRVALEVLQVFNNFFLTLMLKNFHELILNFIVFRVLQPSYFLCGAILDRPGK